MVIVHLLAINCNKTQKPHLDHFWFQGEDEGDGEDDNNEDDDGFFVPHGYLSDDEGVEDGDEDCEENEENKVIIVQLHFVEYKVQITCK